MTLYKGVILTFEGLTEKDKENTGHHTFEVVSYEQTTEYGTNDGVIYDKPIFNVKLMVIK